MARGRVITPEFWTDGNMIGVSAFARLFYIGLWNFAYCDKGHLPDDALGLRLKVLPGDNVNATDLIAELMDCGRVQRVQGEGETFLFMPKFARHQKTDPRWKTRCPACALETSPVLMETPVSYAEPHQSSALREENQREIERKEPERNIHARPSVESVFDAAYSHWPKKVERKPALEKFKAASKRIDLDTLAEHIIRFGDAYAATTPRKYTPALGIWITKERWTDELPTAPEADRKPTRGDNNLAFVQDMFRNEQADRLEIDR